MYYPLNVSMISYHIIAQHMQQLNSYLRYYKSLSLYTSWYSVYVRGYWKPYVCSQVIRSVLLKMQEEINRPSTSRYLQIHSNRFVRGYERMQSERRGHHCRPRNITQHNIHTHAHTLMHNHTHPLTMYSQHTI